MGTTAAPAGHCTSCVSGVGGSYTPCVFVVGTPILFVRVVINVTAPPLLYPVACEPATAMVKPGFTGASPPDADPPIWVGAVFTTRPSNNVQLALAPSSFVFGGW